LLYLAFPYAIFLAGWLKWYVALFGLGILGLALFSCLRASSPPGETAPGQSASFRLKPRHIAAALLAALLLLAVSGVGGYGHQDNPDWLKHNAILADLVQQPWPVVYDYGGQPTPLVYYLGFYLPAAGVGKLVGWSWANQGLFIWGWLGLTLALLWFLTLLRRTGPGAYLLFAVFSGLDVIGRSLVLGVAPELVKPFVRAFTHIEHWAFGWQYSSQATLLFWVPNQAIAGWVATGLLVFTILNPSENSRKCQLFVVSLTALWSPFVTAGLIPFLLADFIVQGGGLPQRIKRYASVPNLGGLVLLTAVGLFYASQQQGLPSALGEPAGLSIGFIPNLMQRVESRALPLFVLLAFWLLEFGLYCLLIAAANRRRWDAPTRGLFVAMVVSLLLFPLLRVGTFIDFLMRASIPALFILAIFLGWTLFNRSTALVVRIALIVLLLIGSVTPLVEYRRHVAGVYASGAILQTPPQSSLPALFEADQAFPIHQYVGGAHSLFFERLARPQNAVAAGLEPLQPGVAIKSADPNVRFEGWYDAESTEGDYCRWSQGASARLFFLVDPLIGQGQPAVTVAITAGTHYSQTIQVMLNGAPIGVIDSTVNWDPIDYTFVFDSSQLRTDGDVPRMNEMEFLIPDARSPASLHAGSFDERVLGLCLWQMEFR
jgi:hypothetical protein